jgi:hypothetical protein
MKERTTPEKITELKDNQIFVFASNLSGIHGKGAALTARKWGAIFYQSSGLQGQTWAIPTKDASIKRTLSTNEIKPFVDDFIEFAKANSQLTFLVTEIGCGLAGMIPKQIAPLFRGAIEVDNIFLPKRFWDCLI